MADILGPFDFITGITSSLKNWIIPIGTIALLFIIIQVIRLMQKKSSERNLKLLRK
jgi:hypothetical protein